MRAGAGGRRCRRVGAGGCRCGRGSDGGGLDRLYVWQGRARAAILGASARVVAGRG